MLGFLKYIILIFILFAIFYLIKKMKKKGKETFQMVRMEGVLREKWLELIALKRTHLLTRDILHNRETTEYQGGAVVGEVTPSKPQLIGERGALYGMRRAASVRSAEPSVLWRVSSAAVQAATSFNALS